MAKELDRFEQNPKKNVSLKTKLIAMIVGASVVGVFISGAVALAVFNRGVLAQSVEELENTTGGVNWILEDWLDTLNGYGDMLASTDHIKGYLDPNDNTYTDDPNAYLKEKGELCGIDLLAITDTTGTIYAGWEINPGEKPDLPIIKSAINGKKSYAYSKFGDLNFGLIVATPVVRKGKSLGCLIAAYDIGTMGSDGYVTIVHDYHTVECTVFDGKTRAATTLGSHLVNTQLDNEAIVQKVLYDGEQYVGKNTIANIEYYTGTTIERV